MTLFFVILVGLRFTVSPENTAYRIGQSSPLVLKCTAESSQPNIVDWTFGTTKLTDGGTLYPNFRTTLKIEGSYDLVFLRANFLSAGRYTCTARTQTLEENRHAEVIIIAGRINAYNLLQSIYMYHNNLGEGTRTYHRLYTN